MAPAFRTVTKRIFIVVNIVVVVVFLLACANRFLEPSQFWMVSFLSLAFPFLLFFVAAFVIFWILFRSKWVFFSIAALVIGWSNIRALIGFNKDVPYQKEKPADCLRILTWNVRNFNETSRTIEQSTSKRVEIFDFITEYQPDVLCFQEFLEPNYVRFYSNVNDLARLGYKYHFYVADYQRENKRFQIGVAIFSKFPVTDSARYQYQGPRNLRAAESLIYADLDIRGEKVRIFNTHLQSVLFQERDYRNVEIIKNAEDSMLAASKSLVRKLKTGYALRSEQVALVRKLLDESPYPEVICGDFNDVPNSYTYFKVRGDRKDAFHEKGNGIGRTFKEISPTLRIDYIMADRQFEVVRYKRFLVPYSDHYPVMSDLKLPAGTVLNAN
ncbi:MAG TPA: endonuclease/exonuclease/phosphatase family protein [Flavitalea sp.]|nr:endonuclease/exonuclease/phosphatase family protein [Flavitalea sp.]